MAKKAMKVKQQRKQKFSSREYSRCKICGRPHAYLRKYGICRICFRELAYKAKSGKSSGRHRSEVSSSGYFKRNVCEQGKGFPCWL